MRYLGLRRMGSLRHRGRVLPPAERPWITDLTHLCPFDGVERGNLPEFEVDPDWAAWELGDTPSSDADALGWHSFEAEQGGILIADRMLMSRISWADLDAAGYVYGREVEIDGTRFRARLLTGGMSAADDPMAGAADPNEWDNVLSGQPVGAPRPELGDHSTPLTEVHKTSAHNAQWNWFGAVSWVQDICAGRPDGRVCRGYHGPLFFYENTVNHRHEDIGWRPVLEMVDV